MAPIISVIFFIVIGLPDHQAFRHSEPMPDVISCLHAEMEFLSRAAQRAIVDGRIFEAGCSVMLAPVKPS